MKQEFRQGEHHRFDAAEALKKEGMHGKSRTPGGPTQTGGADKAREAMIERHKQTIKENGYVTPDAAMDEFMREPEGTDDAAKARARMIERMEKKDEERDKSRSLAQRSPHRDSREDPLISAALRDVRDAFGAKRKRPAGGQGAAEAARAAMIDRKNRK